MHRSKPMLLFDHVVRREIQPILRPGFCGMKYGFRRRATAGRGLDRSVGAQLMNSTLVPLWTIFASACASQLVRWTQPCDWVLPMLCGSGVPWMP